MRLLARQTSRVLVFVAAFSALSAHATKLQFGLRGGGTVSGDSASALSFSNLGYTLGVGFRTIGNGFIQANVDALLASRRYEASSVTVTTRSLYAPAQIVFNLNTLFVSGGAYYAAGLGSASGTSDYGWLAGVGFRTERFSLEARYSRGLKNAIAGSDVTVYNQYVDLLVGLWLF